MTVLSVQKVFPQVVDCFAIALFLLYQYRVRAILSKRVGGSTGGGLGERPARARLEAGRTALSPGGFFGYLSFQKER